MLTYVPDIRFADEEVERARRVELYRQQVEASGFHLLDDDVSRHGPYAQPVFCDELAEQFPNGFATLRAAAAHIGTKRSFLRSAIRKGCRCKGYTFRYLDLPKVKIGTGRERPVRCLTDGCLFASLALAAQHGGVACSTLCGTLKAGGGNPVRCGGKLWQYEDDCAAPATLAMAA